MRRLAWIVIAAVCAVAAVLATAAPAIATDSAVVSSATLVARGAAVDVTMTITCDPYIDWTGTPSTAVDLTVQFRQAVRKDQLTSASYDSGYQNLCDGSPHLVQVQMLPYPYAAIKGAGLFVITESFNTFGGTPVPQTFSDVADVR